MTDPADILSDLDFHPELPCEFRKHWVDTKHHDEGPAMFWLQVGHDCADGIHKRKVHAICERYAGVLARTITEAEQSKIRMSCGDCHAAGYVNEFLYIIGRIK